MPKPSASTYIHICMCVYVCRCVCVCSEAVAQRSIKNGCIRPACGGRQSIAGPGMANQSQFGKAKKKVLDEAPSSAMSLLPTTSTGAHSAKLQPQALNGRGMGMGKRQRQSAGCLGDWVSVTSVAN